MNLPNSSRIAAARQTPAQQAGRAWESTLFPEGRHREK